jgi:hypothetical protein
MAYQSGSLWCETPNPHKEWMVEMSFSVYGRTAAGGEGFVFWYTEDQTPPKVTPDFYGHSSVFKGLAVVFDTSDTAMGVSYNNVAFQSVYICFREQWCEIKKGFSKLCFSSSSSWIVFSRIPQHTRTSLG